MASLRITRCFNLVKRGADLVLGWMNTGGVGVLRTFLRVDYLDFFLVWLKDVAGL